MVFRVERDPSALFVEHTEWGWAGGRIYKHALRIDPQALEIHVRAFAEGLSLQALLRLVGGKSARAEGTLFGMLPIRISRSDPAGIRFGRGFLYATPGGGWWRFGGGAGKVVKHLLRNAARGTAENPEERRDRDRVAAGFLDFEYRMLKVDFVEDRDEIRARVTTSGRALDPQNPLEYERLVFDFPRFGRNLRQLIIVQTGVAQRSRQDLKGLGK